MSEQRKRVYISLYQTHLPKLIDARIIEYERETGEIHLSRCGRVLDMYLDDMSPGIPWNHYYLVLSFGSILLVSSVWFEIYPLSLLSNLVTVIVILTAYSIVAIGQYLYYRQYILQEIPPEPRRIEGQ